MHLITAEEKEPPPQNQTRGNYGSHFAIQSYSTASSPSKLKLKPKPFSSNQSDQAHNSTLPTLLLTRTHTQLIIHQPLTSQLHILQYPLRMKRSINILQRPPSRLRHPKDTHNNRQ
jgi:hypothetical protein